MQSIIKKCNMRRKIPYTSKQPSLILFVVYKHLYTNKKWTLLMLPLFYSWQFNNRASDGVSAADW